MANDHTAHTDGFGSLVGWGVLLLYLFACFLPCIDCGPAVAYGDLDFHVFDRGSHYGLSILLFGWCGGNNGVPWAANVFLALGLLCLWLGRLHRAMVLGVIACLLGLTTWWVRRYDTLVISYYVWQTSQFVLVGGAFWAIRRSTGHADKLPPVA